MADKLRGGTTIGGHVALHHGNLDTALLPKTYQMSSGGTFGDGPSGWSGTKTGTGTYSVTHNLNLPNPNTQCILPIALSGSGHMSASVTRTADGFTYEMFNAAGTNVDISHNVIWMQGN